jgi:hypothetical protein
MEIRKFKNSNYRARSSIARTHFFERIKTVRITAAAAVDVETVVIKRVLVSISANNTLLVFGLAQVLLLLFQSTATYR